MFAGRGSDVRLSWLFTFLANSFYSLSVCAARMERSRLVQAKSAMISNLSRQKVTIKLYDGQRRIDMDIDVSNARLGFLTRLTQRQQYRQKSGLDCAVINAKQHTNPLTARYLQTINASTPKAPPPT